MWVNVFLRPVANSNSIKYWRVSGLTPQFRQLYLFNDHSIQLCIFLFLFKINVKQCFLNLPTKIYVWIDSNNTFLSLTCEFKEGMRLNGLLRLVEPAEALHIPYYTGQFFSFKLTKTHQFSFGIGYRFSCSWMTCTSSCSLIHNHLAFSFLCS